MNVTKCVSFFTFFVEKERKENSVWKNFRIRDRKRKNGRAFQKLLGCTKELTIAMEISTLNFYLALVQIPSKRKLSSNHIK